MMKRLLCAGLLFLSACGESSGTSSIDGTWELVSVNGSSLPGLSGCCTQILADILIVRPDGSFTETYTLRDALGSTTGTFVDDGQWSLDGRTITLVYPSTGDTAFGTWNRNTMRITFDTVWEFVRQ